MLTLPDAARLLATAETVAEACRGQRFGDCALLAVEQSGGDRPRAEVRMRLAPEAVAPTVALVTSAGGTLAERTTRAEDLAETLSDLRREREALQAQRARLEAVAAGRGLAAADAIALAAELGRIDAQLRELDASERQQQRRLDTNRLDIVLGLDRAADRWAAFDGLGGPLLDAFAGGLDESLGVLVVLLPMALVLLLPVLGLALLWRGLWRWATRPRD